VAAPEVSRWEALANLLPTAAAAAAVLVLAVPSPPSELLQAVMATALHYQVAVFPLLRGQAKVITAAQPVVMAAAVPLLFGVAVVAVVAQMAPPLKMLAVIASTVVMAVHPTPAPLHPYQAVVVARPIKQQLLAVLAVLAFVSFTSGDYYGLRNR
jgi:hypothetical protein